MLETAVRSACRIVDHLIAVDGRYALFEHPDVVSGPEQYDAIAGACQDSGTTCELVGVAAPWDGPHGGEVAKRAFMFERAEAVTTTADWHLVFDSDLEFIDPDVRTLRTRLADTNLDVGTAMVNHEGAVHPHPVFFRALRGLTVSERHWRYTCPAAPFCGMPMTAPSRWTRIARSTSSTTGTSDALAGSPPGPRTTPPATRPASNGRPSHRHHPLLPSPRDSATRRVSIG